MIILIIVIDALLLLRYKEDIFKIHANKFLLILSLIIFMFATVSSKEIIYNYNSIVKINAGLPFTWFIQNLGYNPTNFELNFFDFSNSIYRIDIMSINITLIYIFVSGIKNTINLVSGIQTK